MFQATNGSGKTLAFGIPSIMAVDPSIDGIQVIILANTRELIRQVQAVIEVVAKNTKVTSCIGDKDTKESFAHILVTVPGWLSNMLGGRKKFDLSHLKMVAFDEADEIFLQESNLKAVSKLNQHLKKVNVEPQRILFSATFTPEVEAKIGEYCTNVKAYLMQNTALKLKGVKMFRMFYNDLVKMDAIQEVYETFDMFQTMIFVNKKNDAESV